MQTQVTCPQCGTPYTAEVHQVVDAQRTPELKQQLLNGRLNMAICPNCGYGGQMSTILLFHDAEYEKFIVHVPPQLNLDEMRREQMIGQLTRQAMDNLPPEARRAYMLQPQTILNMQTFMENVLETEGITKEMIERQRKQSELLATLARADSDVADHLIRERMSEIDEAFFAMLQSYLDAASQMQDNKQFVQLTNLRYKLMTQTPTGKRIEQQQMALHALNRDAKKAGGLSPQMLLDHILKNLGEQDIVDAIVETAQQAITYDFFSLLTAEIEKREKSGEKDTAVQLTNLRDDLLELQNTLREQSRQVINAAMQTLQAVLEAPDKEAALAAHADKIDDAFMYVLQAQVASAQEQGDNALVQALVEIQSLIMAQIEQQMPPHIQFLNQLVRAESLEQQQQMLDENEHLLSPDMLTMMDQVIEQAGKSGDAGLNGRLQDIKKMLQARMG
ncbi:MAG: hypothetical protein KC421_07920 [Anaerolineales bacterium]|nr:hypothetical protein [Anaerolineales bacterium]